ncbi:MAG: hypothetical protein IJY06_10135 [Oscillospiraceae bacterium]|jgi:hypothetical protein|nr:hypothetical protein [Oscillospiraceae bacterium]
MQIKFQSGMTAATPHLWDAGQNAPTVQSGSNLQIGTIRRLGSENSRSAP